MENKNILLIAIAILIIAVIGIATQNNTNNTTIVGDNSVLNISALNKTNGTYKIYDPQSDSYVTVIGEKFGNGVNRWYTYDKDGVRYYNTRINH